MPTYSILKPIYRGAGLIRPPEPAKPYEIFTVSWAEVGRLQARTVEEALTKARLTHTCPIIIPAKESLQ